jgi:hypothetical protein
VTYYKITLQLRLSLNYEKERRDIIGKANSMVTAPTATPPSKTFAFTERYGQGVVCGEYSGLSGTPFISASAAFLKELSIYWPIFFLPLFAPGAYVKPRTKIEEHFWTSDGRTKRDGGGWRGQSGKRRVLSLRQRSDGNERVLS